MNRDAGMDPGPIVPAYIVESIKVNQDRNDLKGMHPALAFHLAYVAICGGTTEEQAVVTEMNNDYLAE
ncbi:hypothetical protein H0V99_03045 [Candidatus Saccharibacteria bacterium]|nr:hypothetical protein [Candidatus Saccharibacteria bacterium]